MATADQKLDRILETVRQLPEAQRARLLQKIAEASRTEQARAVAARLRGSYRLQAPARRRLSALLAKGNAGPLSDAEQKELDRLVAEFEKKTLMLAQAITAVSTPNEARECGRRNVAPAERSEAGDYRRHHVCSEPR